MKNLVIKFIFVLVGLPVVLFFSGCKDEGQSAQRVVVLSPHSENIKYEIERGFKGYYLAVYGEEVLIDWRDVGSGGNAMLSYIRNIYSRSQTCGIDILFGAGEIPHQYLAAEGLLEAYKPAGDYFTAVPSLYSGSKMYDENHFWHGCVLSGFGFLYNKELLEQIGLAVPRSWLDLGKSDYHNHIILADPSQSSSVAAVYEMILQSQDTWQAGWENLLSVLGNAKKFTASSSAAVNAPIIGEGAIATCIDYYGALAVEQAPEVLGFSIPRAGSGFTADPVSILKNPPSRQLAEAFVDYVLSFEGQALWALTPKSAIDAPEKHTLNRSPIRRDFYEKYADDMPKWMSNPYAIEPLEIDAALRSDRYDVVIELVKACAIDNSTALNRAKRIVDNSADPKQAALFFALPEDVDTIEKIIEIHNRLDDEAFRQQLRSRWTRFFREKYATIISNP